MRTILLISGLVISALLVACDQQPVAPVADQVSGVAFNWLNNPDNGNPRIFRSETDWINCWSDAENGLRACHSTIPLGGGTEPDCGPQEGLDLVEWQQVGDVDPNDPFSSRVHTVIKGDVFITVRDTNEPGTCFGAALVAEGPGRFQYNDNDAFGTVVNNTNAFKYRANGRLTAPDGSEVVYNGHLTFLFGEEQGFRVLSAMVNAQ
jgi:hypothetical protein